jgi:hypothetical protein
MEMRSGSDAIGPREGGNPSRRRFLAESLACGVVASGLAGTAPANPPTPAAIPTVRKPARHVIFVLMSGGPSQMETFDPKPGMPTGGPFGTIPTNIPGVRFCEYLPRLAAMTDHFAVVRSVTAPNPAGDHLVDLQCTLTGHRNASRFAVVRPSFGSIVAHEFGKRDAKLPGYINLSPSWHVGAFQGAGCLGPKYDMMKFPGFGKTGGITGRADGVSETGFHARSALRDDLGRHFLQGRQAEQAQRYEESFARARGLMGATELFDLSREPARVRDRYGPSRYGADCLTARRLIEAGVPFVLIQCFGTRCDWDWHYEAFSHLSKYMLGVFDHVTTTLIEDLRQRGLWDETLLICTGEFGRTPDIGSNEANGYGGRAHYGKNYAMMLAGGPIRGGQVVGKTNARGTEIVERPVTVGDLYRTYYPALGISPTSELVVNGQPIPIQEEGEQTLTELLQ